MPHTSIRRERFSCFQSLKHRRGRRAVFSEKNLSTTIKTNSTVIRFLVLTRKRRRWIWKKRREVFTFLFVPFFQLNERLNRVRPNRILCLALVLFVFEAVSTGIVSSREHVSSYNAAELVFSEKFYCKIEHVYRKAWCTCTT